MRASASGRAPPFALPSSRTGGHSIAVTPGVRPADRVADVGVGGEVWLFTAAIAAGLLVWRFWARLFGPAADARRGRWIRDRSLGGKMVFLAEDEEGGGGGGAGRPGGDGAARWKPKGLASAAVAPRSGAQDAEALGRAVARMASAAKSPDVGDGDELPEWWEVSVPLPVTESARLEARKRARRQLSELEAGKVVAGRDYDSLGLVRLWQTCRDGDVDVAGAVSTTAGRDAMLRHAVRDVAAGAATGSGAAAAPPAAFLCGLAAALGVPERRTVTIVHAAVAAEVRAALIDATAARRAGDEAAAAAAARRVVRVCDALPMPADAAEAGAVGAALQDRFTGAEVEGVLRALALERPQRVRLFTVLLGLDPAATVPLLERFVAQQRGEAAAGGRGDTDGQDSRAEAPPEP